MLASCIGWILIVSGVATAAGGLAACLFPLPVRRPTETAPRYWRVPCPVPNC